MQCSDRLISNFITVFVCLPNNLKYTEIIISKLQYVNLPVKVAFKKC